MSVGSPPRAWGQSLASLSLRSGGRFTPTGVGTIPTGAPVPPAAAVHPHGRGDNGFRRIRRVVCPGSPPRAWGQWRLTGARISGIRFTPTGVGTMPPPTPPTSPPPVHPHGRGDNSRIPSEITIIVRFTPTGVGTIPVKGAKRLRSPVHPHGRGDNRSRLQCAPDHLGSPPRAWGQFLRRTRRRAANRFTPTGVGTMKTRLLTRLLRSVHPHGRGDNFGRSRAASAQSGSPPRAWGQ